MTHKKMKNETKFWVVAPTDGSIMLGMLLYDGQIDEIMSETNAPPDHELMLIQNNAMTIRENTTNREP